MHNTLRNFAAENSIIICVIVIYDYSDIEFKID